MPHDQTTDLFFSLTPERVLDAVEDAGLRCNPVCHPLNSYMISMRKLLHSTAYPGIRMPVRGGAP